MEFLSGSEQASRLSISSNGFEKVNPPLEGTAIPESLEKHSSFFMRRRLFPSSRSRSLGKVLSPSPTTRKSTNGKQKSSGDKLTCCPPATVIWYLHSKLIYHDIAYKFIELSLLCHIPGVTSVVLTISPFCRPPDCHPRPGLLPFLRECPASGICLPTARLPERHGPGTRNNS